MPELDRLRCRRDRHVSVSAASNSCNTYASWPVQDGGARGRGRYLGFHLRHVEPVHSAPLHGLCERHATVHAAETRGGRELRRVQPFITLFRRLGPFRNQESPWHLGERARSTVHAMSQGVERASVQHRLPFPDQQHCHHGPHPEINFGNCKASTRGTICATTLWLTLQVTATQALSTASTLMLTADNRVNSQWSDHKCCRA